MWPRMWACRLSVAGSASVLMGQFEIQTHCGASLILQDHKKMIAILSTTRLFPPWPWAAPLPLQSCQTKRQSCRCSDISLDGITALQSSYLCNRGDATAIDGEGEVTNTVLACGSIVHLLGRKAASNLTIQTQDARILTSSLGQ